MSRDPARLALGGPAGARLARALRASRKVETPYDAGAGFDRFQAALGAAAMVGAAEASVAAEHALHGASGSTAKTVAGATKAALGVKATVSSILLMGAIGSAALVGTSQVLRHSEPSRMSRGPGDALTAASAPPITSPPPLLPTAPPALGPPLARSPGPFEAPPVAVPSNATPTAVGMAEHQPVPSSAPPATQRPPGQRASASGSSRSSTALKPEMEQLATIRRTHDPVKALALAEEGHARFPRGLFWQERESVAISSLARIGQISEARIRARRFIARHPESLYVEELRRMLEE